MSRFVTDKQMLKILRNIMPHRQHKNTVLEIEHSGFDAALMLDGDVLGRQQLGKKRAGINGHCGHSVPFTIFTSIAKPNAFVKS